ncbi:MAG: InlB B-repeat-containing protein [Clostridiales bacterium]|nr:InlB B-repeat-containing protein [Clostridiales bacterium]
MKKRLLIALLTLAALLACVFGMAACANNNQEKQSAQATQFTVTLKANGGTFTDGRTIATVTVDAKSSIDGLVPYPVSDGYVFDGWAENENGTALWDLSTQQVTKNITLYAVWAERVTVTYYANGGKFSDDSDTIELGQKKGAAARLPEQPERENYVFGGWYKGTVSGGNVTLTEGFDGSTTVDSDISVYAKWVLETGARLPKPTDLKVEDDKITWSEVSGASGYRVIVCDSEMQQLQKETVSGNAFTYYFSSRGENDYVIKVCALGDGVNYVTSEYATKNFHYGLSSLNTSFDFNSSELTWEPADKNLPAATSYGLEIYDVENNNKLVYTNENTTATRLDMSSFDAGEYSVKITSKKASFTSNTSELTVNKLRLATPNVDVSIEDENGEITKVVLTWGAVKHASRYYLTVGSSSVYTTSTTYTITGGALSGGSSVFGFTAAEGTVAVRAYDADCDYLVSLPKEAAINTSALVKISASAKDDTDTATNVNISGALYKYNEAPFTVTFDYFSNLLRRYPVVSAMMDYYDFNTSSNSRVSGAYKHFHSVSQQVSATSRVQYPELYRLSVTPILYELTSYVACGWFTDADCTIPFDFTAPVTKNIRVYAGWVDLEESLKSHLVYNQNPSTGVDAYKADGVGYSDFNRKYKVIDTYSATEDKNVYFTTRVAHQYVFKYKNAQSGTNTVTIKNLTTGSVIKTISVSSMTQSTYTFDGKIGDVFKITFSHTSGTSNLDWEMWHDNESNRTLEFPYGGKAGNSNWGNLSSITAKEIYAIKGTKVTLIATPKSGKTFLGWFDNNSKKVSEELTYTFTATADVEYTAKWE